MWTHNARGPSAVSLEPQGLEGAATIQFARQWQVNWSPKRGLLTKLPEGLGWQRSSVATRQNKHINQHSPSVTSAGSSGSGARGWTTGEAGMGSGKSPQGESSRVRLEDGPPHFPRFWSSAVSQVGALDHAQRSSFHRRSFAGSASM
jgi:hypothetical protein